MKELHKAKTKKCSTQLKTIEKWAGKSYHPIFNIQSFAKKILILRISGRRKSKAIWKKRKLIKIDIYNSSLILIPEQKRISNRKEFPEKILVDTVPV
jgi:hypothetical protein